MKKIHFGAFAIGLCLCLSSWEKTPESSGSDSAAGEVSGTQQGTFSATVPTNGTDPLAVTNAAAGSQNSTAEMTTTVTNVTLATGSSSEKKEYESILQSYFAANATSDSEKLLDIMYPKKLIDGFHEYGMINQILSENLQQSDNSRTKEYEITDIIEVGALQTDELALAMKNYDQLLAVFQKFKEWGCGPDALNDAQRRELAEIMDDSSTAPSVFTASKGYDVTVYYNVNGKPDEDYFYIYDIDGDGWKLTNSMRKYIQKSKETSATSSAKNVYTAYSMELFELADSGVNPKGAYIIGSNDKMNYNVPDTINISDLRKKAQDDIRTIDDSFFVVIQDGECVYVAADKNGVCGTYPPTTIPKWNGQKIETEDVDRLNSYSLESLFEIAKEMIR